MLKNQTRNPLLWDTLNPQTRQQLVYLWTDLLYRQIKSQLPLPSPFQKGGFHEPSPQSQNATPSLETQGRGLYPPVHSQTTNP